jgi:hypothetical protein
MHRFIFRWRFLALAAPIAAMAALVFLGGGGTRSLAAGPLPGAAPNLTGVSCADVFVDLANNGIADDINGNSIFGDDGDITSLTMARTEPSQTVSGKWDVTTVSYLGFAPGGFVPGGPPGPSCRATTLAAIPLSSAAEANKFGGMFQVPYANQYGYRPTSIGTYTQCIGALPAPGCTGQVNGSGILEFSTCGYSEAQSTWVRIDSTTRITKAGKAAGTANDGYGVLYLGADGPAAGHGIDLNGDGVFDAADDGTTCAPGTAFAYHFLTKNYTRDARTDFLTNTKNSVLGILADADGPPDGLGNQVADTADGKADDWDGDGCTDWDELGKGFKPTIPLTFPPVYVKNAGNNAVSGMDPFNPADCDMNFTSTISMTTTIVHNTNGAAGGTNAIGCTFVQILGNTCPPGNGQYFRCIGSFSQTKSGSQPLSYRLGCYADSTVTTVNSTLAGGNTTCPPANDEMCGDGKAGQPPAGCLPNPGSPTWCSDATAGSCPTLPCAASRFVYTGIDPATYPVVGVGDATHNYVDKVANQVHLGGCFAGFGGGAFGNVYGSSAIDLHTGAGSFQIYLNQTVQDCQNGTPQGGAINGQITIVELRTEKGLTAAQMYDSDRDGCADSQELLASQGAGGVRDPYNPNDYFNPEKANTPNQQTVADILKVVGKYGKNQGNVLYTAATDRTAVPGGQVWTLGAPDGQQTVADILAAVKQYNHNCMFSAP